MEQDNNIEKRVKELGGGKSGKEREGEKGTEQLTCWTSRLELRYVRRFLIHISKLNYSCPNVFIYMISTAILLLLSLPVSKCSTSKCSTSIIILLFIVFFYNIHSHE